MKSFFILFATVTMAVTADADTVIQESSIRIASNSFTVCPDQSSTCPTGSSCCKLIRGVYGCCEYPQERVSSYALEDPSPPSERCHDGTLCERKDACCSNARGSYFCCHYPKRCYNGQCYRPGLVASPWQMITRVKASMSQPEP